MAAHEDPSLWHQVSNLLGLVAGTLVALIWGDTKRELKQRREDIVNLYERANDANVRLEKHEQQILRLLSDIESEKGTIKLQNERILQALDQVLRQNEAINRALERVAERLGNWRQS